MRCGLCWSRCSRVVRCVRGRPWTDHRLVLEAVIWRFRTGSPWRDLPDRFPPFQTVWHRFNAWSNDGTFEKVLTVLQGQVHAEGHLDWTVSVDSTIARAHRSTRPGPDGATRPRPPIRPEIKKGAQPKYKNSWPEPDDHCLGRSRGGFTTKAHVAVDGAGRPLAVRLTGGQAGDNPQLLPLLDQIAVPTAGRPRKRPDSLLADKAYSHPSTREALRERGIPTVIPQRSDQITARQKRGTGGGRPPNFDTEMYRRRNVVERCFNRLKQWRGIATRYDKTARNYRSGILLASIVLFWL